MFQSKISILILALSLTGTCRGEDVGDLDWNAWEHMPVLVEGRIAPLDTYARETVEAICGQINPMLQLPGRQPHQYNASELLFAWLAEPEKWENVAFLIAQDAELRTEILELPLYDADGRRLCHASPVEVENSVKVGQRWADIQKRSEAEGKAFRLSGVDKKLKNLVDAYGAFRLLTYNPNNPQDTPRRFYARMRSAAMAWRKLAGNLQAANRISRDDVIRQAMVQAGEALQKLMSGTHGGDFSRDKMEAAAHAFRTAGEQLSARLIDSEDRPLAALAANLARQTEELQLSLYDNGETLRLAPALNGGALEANRTPDDDASPWLSYQALLFGSDDLLHAYPKAKIKAVRKAWAEVTGAYLNRGLADRPAKFASAMKQFAEATRQLGEDIEPLRQKLPLLHRDQELIDLTAYPLPHVTETEVFYNRLDPFFWSWTISLVATVCLLLAVGRWQRPLFWLGVAVLIIAQLFTAAGMTLRGVITGLAPLTGMFETVVFVAIYSSLLGIWYALKPLFLRSSNGMAEVIQRRLFALAGAIVGFTAMVLAYYAPATVMHRNIGSVAPILRDNFWLAVHVVTIMASYASAAIALILGHIALGYYLFGRYRTEDFETKPQRRPPEICSTLAGFTYNAIQITVLLLATGTILGAFWADQAWGRFWGWDPKEVWALISLLVYIVILHARYIGWAGDFGMILAAVLGATAVLFTWYGVNFLLGSGMHAYGSGAGGQREVGAAVALQWLFLAAAAVRHIMECRDTKCQTQETEREA